MFSIGPRCRRLEGPAASRCTPREQGPCRWPGRALSCISVSPRVRWRGMPALSRQSLPTRVTPSLERRETVTWASPLPAACPREGLGNRSAIAATRGRGREQAAVEAESPGLLHREHRLQRAGRQAVPAVAPPRPAPSSSPSCPTAATTCGPDRDEERRRRRRQEASAEPGSPLETGRLGC